MPATTAAPVEQTISFQVQPGAAAIVQRAALALGLRVRGQTASADPHENGILVVVLNESIDAYRLAERITGEPAWAREFLRRS